MNMEHPIFNEPFDVSITLKDMPTPKEASHYSYEFKDGVVPSTMPMWQVQTKGYKDDKSLRIGLVSRNDGFKDSPDTEIISGGESMKTPAAVAIARHGNYFLWGFAGSPNIMTEEAKVVFANSVAYMAKMKGAKVIARKHYDRVAVSSSQKSLDLKEKNLLASKPSTREEKAKVKASLTQIEKQKENFNFMYLDIYTAKLAVDEEAKKLKTKVTDVAILDKAITMLEKGKDTEVAKLLLDRYTLCTFETASEWRAWYEKYKEQLFFTRAGGYVFLVNSNDDDVVGNDYKAKAIYRIIKSFEPVELDYINPVAVQSRFVTFMGGEQAIVTKISIEGGYHIYADVAEDDAYIQTELSFTLPEGCELGKLVKPKGEEYAGSETIIYEGETVIVQYIVGNTKYNDIVLKYKYQVCDEESCLPPFEGEEIIKIEQPTKK